MFSNPLLQLVALLFSSATIILTWLWWRNNNIKWFLAALPLAISGLIAWQNLYHNEIGTVYFLLSLTIIAWLLIAYNSNNREVKPIYYQRQTIKAQLIKPKVLTLGIVTHVFLMAIISVVITLAIAQLLPFTQVNRMVIAALSYPVVWPLLSVWLMISQQKKQTYLKLLALTLIATAIIYWGTTV